MRSFSTTKVVHLYFWGNKPRTSQGEDDLLPSSPPTLSTVLSELFRADGTGIYKIAHQSARLNWKLQ